MKKLTRNTTLPVVAAALAMGAIWHAPLQASEIREIDEIVVVDVRWNLHEEQAAVLDKAARSQAKSALSAARDGLSEELAITHARIDTANLVAER